MNTSFDITDIDCAPKELEDALGERENALRPHGASDPCGHMGRQGIRDLG